MALGDLIPATAVGHQFTISTNELFWRIGYRCKIGIYGGYAGNTYNWYWGNGYLDVYIDATPFRVITPSDYRPKRMSQTPSQHMGQGQGIASGQLPAFRLRNADWC